MLILLFNSLGLFGKQNEKRVEGSLYLLLENGLDGEKYFISTGNWLSKFENVCPM